MMLLFSGQILAQPSCCLPRGDVKDTAINNTVTQIDSATVVAAVTSDRMKELEVMSEIDAMERRLLEQNPEALKEKKRRKAWEKRIRQHIRKNSIISGMEPHHVRQSWGEPTHIESLGNSIEKWIYQRKDGRNQSILFERGEVSGWE